MSTKYKNISDMELSIIGVGVVQAGQEFISGQEIINPNIQVIGPADVPQDEVRTEPEQPDEETEE